MRRYNSQYREGNEKRIMPLLPHVTPRGQSTFGNLNMDCSNVRLPILTLVLYWTIPTLMAQ